MKIAVFGAAGWVGRAILENLRAHQHHVRAVDRSQAVGGGHMIVIGLVLAGIPVVLIAYAYLVYPVLLRLRAKAPPSIPSDACPSVTITVPAYNEGERLGATLDRLTTAKIRIVNFLQF